MRMCIAPANNQYVSIPYSANVAADRGSFTWTRTSASSGLLQSSSSLIGSYTGILTFLTSTSGTARFTNATATQDANFTIESIAGSQLVFTSIRGTTITIGITGGTAPLAAYGAYQFVAAGSGSAYNIVPISANIQATSGSYSYSVTGGSTATLTAMDSVRGVTLTSYLTFVNTNAGSVLTTTSVGGSQTGTFLLK